MSGSADYTLTCCPGRGLAEVSRLMFTIAQVPFIDERLSKEEWAARKPSTPFGKLPVLTLKDGSVLFQSKAIERFLAKEFHLMGNNSTEAALIDGIIEQIVDLQFFYWNAKLKGDDGTSLNQWLQKDYLSQLELLETFLSKRKDQSTPYFVGNQLSLADISMYYLLWMGEHGGIGCGASDMEKIQTGKALKLSPHLTALKETIDAIPAIKEYQQKHPYVPM